MLVAKLPGAMCATLATNAGPRKGNRRGRNPFRPFPSSTRCAELTVVTSPGLTTCTAESESCLRASFDGFRLLPLECIADPSLSGARANLPPRQRDLPAALTAHPDVAPLDPPPASTATSRAKPSSPTNMLQRLGFGGGHAVLLALRRLMPLRLGEPGVVRQVAPPQTAISGHKSKPIVRQPTKPPTRRRSGSGTDDLHLPAARSRGLDRVGGGEDLAGPGGGDGPLDAPHPG